jgi:hypothetical protein
MLLNVDSKYQVHIMGCVPHVGFATSSHATVMTHFMLVYIYIYIYIYIFKRVFTNRLLLDMLDFPIR